jgi:hypothetical protein
MEELTQSNNNAKLNKGAKHVIKVAGNECKNGKNKGGTARGRARCEGVVSVGSRPGARKDTELDRSFSLFVCSCPSFSVPLFWTLFFTDQTTQ